MSAGLRVFGFGYQISKPIIEYPSGLKSYPCPYPRAQNTTRIHTQRVGYPRICGYFVPVAIFNRDCQIELVEFNTSELVICVDRCFVINVLCQYQTDDMLEQEMHTTVAACMVLDWW